MSTANPEAVIQIKNLTKRFGKVKALDSVSFEVKEGEALTLWGPNGAGKTTLLRSILGILPFEGKVEVMGFSVSSKGKEARKHIGYIPQEIRFHGDQTVLETVDFYARLRRASIDRVQKLFRDWGLENIKGKSVQTLSGGMKQKLGLVVALLSDPPILLMDEPTSNLDVRARYEFHELLERLKDGGKTLIFCSHRVSEVLKFSDRVIVLKSGLKITEGKLEEVRDHLVGETVLCLTLRKEDCSRAHAVIAQNHLDVRRNATQLWIQVPSGRKSEPLQILLGEGIPVLDFEVESEPKSPASEKKGDL